ncbi:MAG: hypothetical protein IPJ94_09725 [Chloroflexi bacterium]|nr:hypothetical protein [Chloroflexota bacterium]
MLALLCLVYEERGEFPPNTDEIYDEATRALLVKWDSSRNIARDVVYKQLSLKHKQNMLAWIAAETFVESEYFLPEKRVVGLIDTYLQGVPGLEEPDGQLVLQAMEAQHGIFVERARRIHSFSHLTLQEYFAARYIVDNSKRGAVAPLMRRVGDDRWREVFKLTAGMLNDATEFFELYLAAVPSLLNNDAQLLALLSWAAQKSAQSPVAYRPPALRAFLLSRACELNLDLVLNRAVVLDLALNRAVALDLNLNHAVAVALDLAVARDLAQARHRAVARDLARDRALQVAEDLRLTDFKAELSKLSQPDEADGLEVRQSFAKNFVAVLEKYENDWSPYRKVTVTNEDVSLFTNLSEDQIKSWTRYLEANALMVECLKLSYVPDRELIEDQLLLPPI